MPVAALVLGIVGLVLSFVPCLGMYALPLTLLAVVLGAMAMKAPKGRGMAIAGLVCGIVGSLIAAWWVYAYFTVKHAAQDAAKRLEQEDAKTEAAKQIKEAADKAPMPDPAPTTP